MALSNDGDDAEWLRSLLSNVQLEHFQTRIIDELQITRLSHFEYVKSEDLENIGISKPAARRLLEAVKKRKGTGRRSKILSILGGTQSKKLLASVIQKKSDSNTKNATLSTFPLTCLILEKDIKLSEKIGDGSFGIVSRGDWTTSTGRIHPVAVKILKQEAPSLPQMFDDFAIEVQSMHTLDHIHLIKLYGIVLTQPMMMVTELASLGNLRDYLRKQRGHIIITDLWKYALQVSTGMEYLEEKRYIHRDLACRNILLTSLNQVKIGDFGLMRSLPIEENCYVMTEKRRIPFPWCAPESLCARQFSYASDIWMYGVVLWEMFTGGDEPWAGLDVTQVLAKLISEKQRLQQPESCPINLYRLIQQCWVIDPSKRPNIKSIKSYLASDSPIIVKVSSTFEPNELCDDLRKLDIEAGDGIVVIDGQPDLFWWKGQNLRTFQIGSFSRRSVDSIRQKASDDISKPLRNSFIHTGHHEDAYGNNWGFHDKIDQVYLNNPMEPSDLLNNPRVVKCGPPILSNQKNTVHPKKVDLVKKNKQCKTEKFKNTVLTSIMSSHNRFSYLKLLSGHNNILRPASGSPSCLPNSEQILVDLDGCTPPPINQNNSFSSVDLNVSILDQPIDDTETNQSSELFDYYRKHTNTHVEASTPENATGSFSTSVFDTAVVASSDYRFPTYSNVSNAQDNKHLRVNTKKLDLSFITELEKNVDKIEVQATPNNQVVFVQPNLPKIKLNTNICNSAIPRPFSPNVQTNGACTSHYSTTDRDTSPFVSKYNSDSMYAANLNVTQNKIKELDISDVKLNQNNNTSSAHYQRNGLCENVKTDNTTVASNSSSLYYSPPLDPSPYYSQTSNMYQIVTELNSVDSSVIKLCSYFNYLVNEEQCLDALEATSWNYDDSVKYLKTNNLLRLGMGSREACVTALNDSNWDMEVAASMLCDNI